MCRLQFDSGGSSGVSEDKEDEEVTGVTFNNRVILMCDTVMRHGSCV